MKRIVVLGAGLVGKEMAKDLSRYYDVTAIDRNEETLRAAFAGFPVKTKVADLSDMDELKRAVHPFDLVIGSLPGWLGQRALRAIIEAGKDVVDIAFFPEDPFELDELAQRHGVTAIVDMGVAPGMSSLLVGHEQKRMERLDQVEILVGGLPAVREFPFEYKAVFSPIDVIEEYTRPARYIEHGREVVRPALSDPELIHFEGVGTLESFNTDGLRTLARTIRCPNMKEKTLRYPGHIHLMHVLRHSGFFDKQAVRIKGVDISPLEFTSSIMFPQWKLKPGEEEFTVMRVTLEGENRDGHHEKVVYDLLDRFDRENAVTSMARTTGYAATGAARLVADGKYCRRGIIPPEYVAESDECFEFVIAHQKERGIHYRKQTTVTPAARPATAPATRAPSPARPIPA